MIRWAWHRLIVRYLRRCGSAFHHNPYGERGRYVVLMTEGEYHRFQKREPKEEGYASLYGADVDEHAR